MHEWHAATSIERLEGPTPRSLVGLGPQVSGRAGKRLYESKLVGAFAFAGKCRCSCLREKISEVVEQCCRWAVALMDGMREQTQTYCRCTTERRVRLLEGYDGPTLMAMDRDCIYAKLKEGNRRKEGGGERFWKRYKVAQIMATLPTRTGFRVAADVCRHCLPKEMDTVIRAVPLCLVSMLQLRTATEDSCSSSCSAFLSPAHP